MEMSRESLPLSRREVRRNDRRDAILTVAARYFLEHGYAATTMSGIAAALGGSKATLWSYFPSKELLFEAVLDRVTSIFREQIAPLLESGKDFETTLRCFAARFIEKVTTPEAIELHRLVAGEAGRFPEVGRIFYRRGPRATFEMIGHFIGVAMDRGVILRGDPIEAGRVLMELCMSGSHRQMLLGLIAKASPAMIAADADFAVGLFMRAYRPA